MEFSGYVRLDGKVGTRNALAIIPLVFCANHVCQRIAAQLHNSFAFPHPLGCGYPGPDQHLAAQIMKSIARHPNYGAVLFVGLGCERVTWEELRPDMEKLQKPFAYIGIQEAGDSLKAIEEGTRLGLRMLGQIALQKPVPCDISHLVLGVKCGGTDAASGIAANPVLGYAADQVVAGGGTVLITEITELLGTEHIMMRRAKDNAVAAKISDVMEKAKVRLARAAQSMPHHNDVMLVSPGNADGGVTNVVEKALGGLKKAGNSIFSGVVEYGQCPGGKGLYLMDGPGHDGEAVSGLIAAGATVVVFTTGRGTPTGYPGVPVIKSTGNPHLYEKMRINIDFNAGEVISSFRSIKDVGTDMLQCILDVASGKPVQAEILGHEDLFYISRFIATHRFFEGCPAE